MRSVSLQDLDLRRPTFRVRDMLREATLSISGHPLRSLLTMIGTLLSASVFVATLGLSSTVAQQVSSTFDVRRATEVTVKPADREGGDGQAADAGPQEWLSTVALDRLTRLAGIESAGRRVQIERVSVDRFAAPGVVAAEVPVTGVDSAALAAIDPSITQGRSFDAFHDRTASPVALVPANVARDLGISRSGTAVFLDGRAFTVIGIFDNVVSRPETLPAVVIPFAAAQHLSAGDAAAADRDVVIKTAAGAAQQIASQAALALAPGDPASLRAIAPPDPQTLRRQVEDRRPATFACPVGGCACDRRGLHRQCGDSEHHDARTRARPPARDGRQTFACVRPTPRGDDTARRRWRHRWRPARHTDDGRGVARQRLATGHRHSDGLCRDRRLRRGRPARRTSSGAARYLDPTGRRVAPLMRTA